MKPDVDSLNKKDTINLPGHSDNQSFYTRPSDSNLTQRLKEMEDLNSCLSKLSEQQNRKLNEVITSNTKFISIIAHDLRNPFSSILGALELLRNKMEHYHIDDVDKYIDIASNSAKKTLSLLENLLEWTGYQNNVKGLNPVRINLHELLAEVFESVNPSATQKNLTLKHFIHPGINVTADLQMVKTIFRNLISNAIKYTNCDGEINITATNSKPLVEIAIKDNGIGISHIAIKKLFKIDEFKSTTGTHDERGTGLGLLFCKEFIELHGGTIRAESEQGKGCKFIFTLPHYI